MLNFPKKCHVASSDDFRRAYKRRISVADAQIVVFAHPNDLQYARLGISASRRIGGAVVRNRWKRLIREAFRLSRQNLPAGLDFIVIPRAAARPSLHALRESMPKLAAKLSKKLAAK